MWFLGITIISLFLLGVLSLLQKSIIAEGFEQSANLSMQDDLSKLIKHVNSIGKKLLDPEMWNYRIKIMNLSPVELARKQITGAGVE